MGKKRKEGKKRRGKEEKRESSQADSHTMPSDA
jgi:hypothetical protein